MKKIFVYTASVLGGSFTMVQAAAYLSDFSSLTPGAPLEGTDGWGQSSPNEFEVDAGDNVITYPWAYGTRVITSPPGANTETSDPAAAVGGYYNTFQAPGGSFYASHALSLEEGMLFEMTFAINDSTGFLLPDDPFLYGTERNSFRISFYDQAYEVFSLVFDPNFNPNSISDTDDTWNVSSSSGGTQTLPVMAIFEDQLYTLRLSLLPRNGNLEYLYSLTSDNTANGVGVLTGLTGQIDSLRIGIDAVGGEYGTNQLLFNGIAATAPEPSASLLAMISSFAVIFRRKR